MICTQYGILQGAHSLNVPLLCCKNRPEDGSVNRNMSPSLCRQVSPFHRPQRPLGRVDIQLYSIFDLGTRRGVRGQRHAPAAPYPQGKTWYPLYRRLGGHQRWSGEVRKILPPHWDSIPRPSSLQAVTILTTLPGHTKFIILIIIICCITDQINYLYIQRDGSYQNFNNLRLLSLTLKKKNKNLTSVILMLFACVKLLSVSILLPFACCLYLTCSSVCDYSRTFLCFSHYTMVCPVCISHHSRT